MDAWPVQSIWNVVYSEQDLRTNIKQNCDHCRKMYFDWEILLICIKVKLTCMCVCVFVFACCVEAEFRPAQVEL